MAYISIVTIVYNDRVGLQKTVESVNRLFGIETVLDKIEHVIIDGGSTDGSADFAKSLVQARLIQTIVLSEPDNGIYDAMNKGIYHSSGAGIIFLNAGDLMHPDCCIDSVFSDFQDSLLRLDECGIVYASIFKIGKLDFLIPPRLIQISSPRMPGSHQAMLYKRAALVAIPFSEKFKICGDYDNFVKLINGGCYFKPINRIFSIFHSGGVSSRKPFQLFLESLSISRSNFNLEPHQKILIALKLLFSLAMLQFLLVYTRISKDT